MIFPQPPFYRFPLWFVSFCFSFCFLSWWALCITYQISFHSLWETGLWIFFPLTFLLRSLSDAPFVCVRPFLPSPLFQWPVFAPSHVGMFVLQIKRTKKKFLNTTWWKKKQKNFKNRWNVVFTWKPVSMISPMSFLLWLVSKPPTSSRCHFSDLLFAEEDQSRPFQIKRRWKDKTHKKN